MTWNSIPQPLLLQVNQLMEQLRQYDVETFDHCQRVSHLCRFLANAADLEEHEKLSAQMAGLLHDVGKMKIPLKVLNKPGKLTDEEYNLMKKHALYSAELMAPLENDPFFREIQFAVLHHHERVDGVGYPVGLEGEQIPYLSRLILIVDTVDAMTKTRAYRKGLPMKTVYKELDKFAGRQFDGELVEVFITAYQKLIIKKEKAQIINLPPQKKAA